jgi:hypothetical protein
MTALAVRPRWTLPAELHAEATAAAAQLLRAYFQSRTATGQLVYTGGAFETFAGGGDRPEVAHRLTAEDLVAVSLLSVDVPGAAALRLLGTEAPRLSRLLGAIPADCELVDAVDDQIAPGSPADELWALVRSCGVGPVTTSKLLARKRPRLLPVIDTVVKAHLQHKKGERFSLALRAELSANDRELVTTLVAARAGAALGAEISLIRCFDVIVWMTGKAAGAGSTGPRGRF